MQGGRRQSEGRRQAAQQLSARYGVRAGRVFLAGVGARRSLRSTRGRRELAARDAGDARAAHAACAGSRGLRGRARGARPAPLRAAAAGTCAPTRRTWEKTAAARRACWRRGARFRGFPEGLRRCLDVAACAILGGASQWVLLHPRCWALGWRQARPPALAGDQQLPGVCVTREPQHRAARRAHKRLHAPRAGGRLLRQRLQHRLRLGGAAARLAGRGGPLGGRRGAPKKARSG
jgi:hypothetical protein